MKKIVGILILILLTGCASQAVNENRAGCTFIDGTARYGSFTQYVKGDAKGVHVYVGEAMPSGITLTCNAEKQELTITINETEK